MMLGRIRKKVGLIGFVGFVGFIGVIGWEVEKGTFVLSMRYFPFLFLARISRISRISLMFFYAGKRERR